MLTLYVANILAILFYIYLILWFKEKTIEDECRMNVMSITQLHLASEALSEKENNITTGYADTQVIKVIAQRLIS